MYGPETYLEKPVTAAKFVHAVAKVLDVELEEGTAQVKTPNDLRDELGDLARNADPEALREALKLLKEKK